MPRYVLAVLLALVASLAMLVTPAAAARQFPETGYSVTNDKFLDYFDHRGGARVLGYPISREFTYLGSRVQFFQRAVLQQRPDGSVGMLNLLDDGMLPYTRINGSTFPAPNLSLLQAAPQVSDPDYANKALQFVQANAPDSWEGLNTNFYTTFANTVSYQEAFPGGGADPGLLPLINLEIWGLPISKPTYDPQNGNFVYLRFQRGIMHFDKTNGLTQGILIGDYLKALITGQNLPADLAQDAAGSKLLRQYNNGSPIGLSRSADLPATNMFAAFEKDGVNVAIPQATPVPPPPAPTAVPQPTAVPPTAVPAGPPTSITVTGTPWFIDATNAALQLLSTKATATQSGGLDYWNIVRQNVWRIDDAAGTVSSYDPANHTLHVRETDAIPATWRAWTNNQREWYAGLIVHNAVHIGQALSGVSPTTFASENEARWRQREVSGLIETTDPPNQFFNYVSEAIDGKIPVFEDWQAPRDPLLSEPRE